MLLSLSPLADLVTDGIAMADFHDRGHPYWFTESLIICLLSLRLYLFIFVLVRWKGTSNFGDLTVSGTLWSALQMWVPLLKVCVLPQAVYVVLTALGFREPSLY